MVEHHAYRKRLDIYTMQNARPCGSTHTINIYCDWNQNVKEMKGKIDLHCILFASRGKDSALRTPQAARHLHIAKLQGL